MENLPILLAYTARSEHWDTLLAEVCDWRMRCTIWQVNRPDVLIKHLDTFAPCVVLVDIQSRQDLRIIGEIPGRWPGCKVLAAVDSENPLADVAEDFPLVALGGDHWTADDWRRAMRTAVELVDLQRHRQPDRTPKASPPTPPQAAPTPLSQAATPPDTSNDILAARSHSLRRAIELANDQETSGFVQLAADWFRVNRVAWFTKAPEGFALCGGALRDPDGMMVPHRDGVVQAIRELRHPTSITSLRPPQSQSATLLRLRLEEEGVDWIVPIHSRGVLTGWIWLGGRHDGSNWPERTAECLQDLARSADELRNRTEQDGDIAQAFWPELGRALAHEIRNPLAAIRTMSQLLSEHHEDPSFRASFERRVEHEISRLDNMVNRLERFSEPVTGEVAPVDLPTLAEEIVEEFQEQGIEKIYVGPTELIPPISGRAADIRNTLRYVLRNAIEAGDESACDVSVQIYQKDTDEGEAILLDVIDHGNGLPSSIPTSQLFSPFYSSKARGFGLGLPMAQRNIKAHGGRIELLPRAKGTCVRLVFPIPDMPTPP